jgi:deoxyribose-phosphate aldolase
MSVWPTLRYLSVVRSWGVVKEESKRSVGVELFSGHANVDLQPWLAIYAGDSVFHLEKERTMADFTLADLAKMFDHSLLQPTLTDAEMERGCQVAREYNVASVCIKPYAVANAAAWLQGSSVLVSTVIGFPHGGHRTAIKVAEAQTAMDDGAVELDMVVNIGKVLSKEYGYVRDDVGAVVAAAHQRGVKVKVIFENCYLQDEHKIELCRICGAVGADWVKTSTGYGDSGATDHDLTLMRHYSPPSVQVKAAGGVRTYERVLAVRALGVTRIGATATKAILDECRQKLG